MRIVLILLIAYLSCLSCGPHTHVENPSLWGEVNESLPPVQRSQQDALARLFKALQTGTSIRHLQNYEPDLEFEESRESFFEQGISLARWDWSRQPEGNKHYVRLDILLDEPPGNKTVSYERVYSVTRAGSRYIIRRIV